MLEGHRIVVIMPAYNSASSLAAIYADVVALQMVDEVIIVDDCSSDSTSEVLQSLAGAHFHRHEYNTGYGGNQKTCYRMALDLDADVVIMLHPDYQYPPKLIPAIAGMIVSGIYDCVLGSRILTGGALKGGMPLWRYVSNRLLTTLGNLLIGSSLSEFHSGFRGFSRRLLLTIDFTKNSNDFVFDNEIMAQVCWHGFNIGEISCPTSYHEGASSIGFWPAVRYGLGCIRTAVTYRLARWGMVQSSLFIQSR